MPYLPLAALALALTASPVPGEARPGAAEAAVTVSSTVLLELFTSQGCSSCPPADRLLSELASDPASPGRIVPLAFHVDYWDRLGWRDPYSSRAWSKRQEGYARVLREESVYTPQLVVDGHSHVVGSNRGEVRAAIEAALARPDEVRVGLHVAVSPGPGASSSVAVDVAVEGAVGHAAVVWVALYRDGLETAVQRGENAGRSLHDDRVAVALEPALELADSASDGRGRVVLPLAAGWSVDDMGVIAFVQRKGDLQVLGVAEQSLAGARAQSAAGR